MKTAQPGETRVGFVGLGLMGRPMAANLLRAGYRLGVYNRTAATAAPLVAQGAWAAATPAELAAGCDVVVTMVTDGPDVAAVVGGEAGLLASFRPGSVWIDMSTISPRVTRELGAQAAARGVEALDAPVSGGPPGAEAGTLSIMCGGRQEVFDCCLPVLSAMGQTIVRVGDLGAGQVVKACNQIVVGGYLLCIAEALVFGAKAGVEPAAIREALLGGYGQSRMLDVHGLRMLEHKFDPGFFVRLHNKDLHIVLEMARALEVSTPVAAMAAQNFNSLMAHGEGELDNSAMVKIYERLAGRELI